MNKLYFDYTELISLNFYKLVFKPFICNDFFCNIICSTVRHSLFINTYGFAATEISLNDINNEYSHIEGVKEDVLNLILNIKGVIFRLKKKNKVFLKLKTSKAGEVKIRDIFPNKYVEIINKNHIICHLNKGFKLNLIIKVEKGKGFVPYGSNKDFRGSSDLKNGIMIDSYFCPILRVSYIIEKINDSIFNDLKRVIFFIETDGSVIVKKSLTESINSFLNVFDNFKIFKNQNNRMYSLIYNNYDSVLFISVFDSGLSFRTIKFLYSYKIYILNDLVGFRQNDITDKPGFSKKTLNEIKKILKKYNLFLFNETWI